LELPKSLCEAVVDDIKAAILVLVQRVVRLLATKDARKGHSEKVHRRGMKRDWKRVFAFEK
jgi:hypothetical protein